MMTANAPSRFWIIRKPDDEGNVVARFDTVGETRIDERIVEHDAFIIQSVPDRTALVDKPLETDGLTDYEREILDQI